VTTTTTSFRAPSSPSVSPTTAAASAASEPGNFRTPVYDAHSRPQSCVAPPASTARVEMSQAGKRRRQRKARECQAAMTLLTLRPVFATPVPRLHVEPKAPDGTLLIHDRATSDSFVVYSPRFHRQFHAGHHAGKWYLRPLQDLGAAPCSPAFPAAGLAVDALRTGRWRTSAETSFTSRKRPRVIWSQDCSSLAEEGR
jgi:hypothetical protein